MTDCKKMEQTEDLLSITLYTTKTVLEEEDEVKKDNAVYTPIFTIKTTCFLIQNATCFNQEG
jgi:hypothetical protein